MRKPALGRLSGAGLSKTETAQCGLPFLPDLAPDNRVTDRSLTLGYLRALWWHQHRLGHRLPAELGVILIDGGRR